jgi:predicted MPP superfamily phosphohydrolase
MCFSFLANNFRIRWILIFWALILLCNTLLVLIYDLNINFLKNKSKMRGIPSESIFLFFALVFAVELISYCGFKILLKRLLNKFRFTCTIFYLLFSVTAEFLLAYAFSNPELLRQSRDYHLFYIVIVITVINLIPKTLFSFLTLISLIVRLFGGERKQIILLSGSLILSSSIVFIILFGSFFNRFEVEQRRDEIFFSNLPQQFDGFRIMILSDIHLGSFRKNTTVIRKAVAANKLVKPDLLLFTGDIVNNFGDEMNGFTQYLAQLSASYGKFAILGNHDYGDYFEWKDATEKKDNLDLIEKELTNAGFKMLLNQLEMINVKDTSIALIGVENWGHRPFPQYADLNKAMTDVPANSFKILMSHDPAHWDAQVKGLTDIQLTLSGHTHGGQFGIKFAGIEFSPMYFIQKYWGGLYKEGNQYLYVNRGLGTVGFPGRIEMKPEITVLTLHRSKNQ